MNNRDQQDGEAGGGELPGGAVLALTLCRVAALLLVAGLASSSLQAQTNTAKNSPPSDRCLIIVETSKSMQRRADAVLGVVQDILKSGLNGQLQRGDTLGVWTFNENLYAGRFPLQAWSAQAQKDITSRTLTFLKAQKYEKQARFDKVLAALGRVIKDSEVITVILITSGDDRIQGTPFDGRINEYYQQWREQQQKERMPFVTVLRGKRGQLADYVVNTPPWPLQLPLLASEVKKVETPQGNLAEAARKTPPPAVPPLIISGKKPQSEQAPAPKPEPAVTKAETPPALAGAAITNEPVKAKPPETAAPPVEVAKTEPPPPAPVMPATESAPKQAPAPTPAAPPKTETASAPEAKPVEPAPSKPEPAPPPPAPTPTPEPIPLEQPKPSPAPQMTTNSAPAAVAVPVDAPAVAAGAGVTQPAPPATSSLAPRPSSLPTPPVQNATAVPAGTITSHQTIWIAGLVFAIVAAASALVLIRRSRAAPQGSLITRSFEREKKP